MIRIVQAPFGEAPLWVREAWVGLELPIIEGKPYRRWQTSGVLSGPKTILGGLWALIRGRTDPVAGYAVKGKDALSRLMQHHQPAADWWDENLPQGRKDWFHFVFDEAACELQRPEE